MKNVLLVLLFVFSSQICFCQDTEGWTLPDSLNSVSSSGNLCDSILKYYKANDFKKTKKIIEDNYKQLSTCFDIEFSYGSVIELYLKMFFKENKIDEGIKKALELVSGNPNHLESIIDFCFDNNKLDKAEQIINNPVIADNVLLKARLFALKKNKPLMLENLKSNFETDSYTSKNQIMILKEFENYLDDDDFLNLMKESPNSNLEKMAKYMTDNKQYSFEEIKALLDSIKKYSNDKKSEEIEKHTRALSLISFPIFIKYKSELFELFKKENENIKFKIMLASLQSYLKDSLQNIKIINELAKIDIPKYPNELFQFLFSAAKLNPKECIPIIKKLMDAEGSDVFISQHFMRMSWKTMVSTLLVITEPYCKYLLLDGLKSGNKNVKELSLFTLSTLSSRDVLPEIHKLLQTEKSDSLKIIYQRCLKVIYLPETIELCKQLIKEFPNDSTIYNSIINDLKEFKEIKQRYLLREEGFESTMQKKYVKSIKSEKAKNLLFQNMIETDAMDTSFFPNVLFNSCTKNDIPILKEIRRKAMRGLSDESMGDWQLLNELIGIMELEGI